jgi:two-component system cell cycle response regulator
MRPERSIRASTGIMDELDDSALTQRLPLASRCTVLVVDDDELVRAKLTLLLKQAGYDVVSAASGEEALRVLGSTDCRIAIADWQMPSMNGLALCRYVRVKHTVNYIYFLMLTVRGSKRDVLRGLAAGADDYIVKGAPTEEILARVEVGRRLTHLEQSLRISNRENRRLAVTDPLTGALNRRYLMKYLPREMERSKRYAHPLAILSCDIDGFKQVNDTYGHRAGDEVLHWFVGCTVSSIRDSSDWIARVGGDEFVVVLPETNLHAANIVAQKLRQTFSGQPIATCAGPLHCATSIGATALETTQELATFSVTELLRAADHCLYASKRAGRDRTTAMSAASAGTQLPIVPIRGNNELN